jgi:pyruvate,water dikinase
MLAGAVVVEQAGPLSHAAIIARELGVPAVVNIPGVTTRLRGTRARVTVDGDEGLVIVHGSTTTEREHAATEGEVLAS